MVSSDRSPGRGIWIGSLCVNRGCGFEATRQVGLPELAHRKR